MAAMRFMKCEEFGRPWPDQGRPNRSDGHGLLGLRTRYIPLIATFDALPELTPGLVRLHFRTQVPAFRALLRHGLVPAHEVAVRVVRTAVERLPSLLGSPLGDLTAVLRADDPRR